MLDPIDLGRPEPGKRITARWAQAVNRSVKAQYNSNNRNGYFNPALGNLTRHPVIDNRILYARLTDRGSDPGFFEYTLVEWDTTDKDWTDATDAGGDHTVLGEAWEVSGRELIHLDEIVKLTLSQAVIGADGNFAYEFTSQVNWIWAELTGKTEIGSGDNRYEYPFTEKIQDGNGFTAPAWTALTDVLAAGGKAINSIEANNDGDDAEGHGVDVDGADYPAGFAVIDASEGDPIVKLVETFERSDGVVRSIGFSFENTDDGTCEA